MPKVVDHVLYRKELLQGCLELFAERGYGSITMRQIANGLGVSTGTLYHYFPSKEQIFMQLVQELCEQDISSFFAQAPEAHSLQGKLEAVTAYVIENTHYYQRQLLLWVEFFQQSQRTEDAGASFLRQIWNRTRQELFNYVEIDNPILIDFIMVFIDGLILQYIYDRGDKDRDWFQSQCQLLIQMVVNHDLAST